jgi:hypothetical protein
LTRWVCLVDCVLTRIRWISFHFIFYQFFSPKITCPEFYESLRIYMVSHKISMRNIDRYKYFWERSGTQKFLECYWKTSYVLCERLALYLVPNLSKKQRVQHPNPSSLYKLPGSIRHHQTRRATGKMKIFLLIFCHAPLPL